MEQDCIVCSSDPNAKEYWGCDIPTQIPVWEDEEDVFYNCPLQFIPNTVWDWAEEYGYNKSMPGTAHPFAKQSAKYLEFLHYYNIQMSRLRKKEDGEGNSADKTGDALTALKEAHNARKRSTGKS